MSCVPVAIDSGDWRKAEELVDRLSSIANKHHLVTYARAAMGWQGILAISRDDLARGIELLQTAVAALHEDGYELYRPWFSGWLAKGLTKSGRRELASSTICEAVAWAETRGRALDFIDLLRRKGEILSLTTPADISEGEAHIRQSLELARERRLPSLELRCSISLARLWAGRSANKQALELLEPIFRRFSEGFNTPDLLAAATLLEELRSQN
jgi:predicted ATPase